MFLVGRQYRDPSIEVEGDYDLRGHLGLDDHARPGFGAVRYTVHVDSDADEATLEEIRHPLERTSPRIDNVLNRR